MHTKTLIRSVLAASALAWASASIAAVPTVPQPQPPTIPSTGLPTNVATNGSGPLLVAVWDSATGSSLVQYLGLEYNQLGVPDMTVAGTVLDFGNLGGFSTTFASAIGAGETSRLQYLVVAADTQADQAVGIGDPFNRGLRVTGAPNLATETVASGDSGAPNVAGAGNAVVNFINDVINASNPFPLACNKANPCSVTGDASSPIYFGKATAGRDLGGAAPATTQYSGAVGTALGFFDLTSEDATDFLSNGRTRAFAAQYSGAQWLLDAAGHLVYSVAGGGPGPVVPLPAAGWLLLSGLASMGVIGRRRKTPVAA